MVTILSLWLPILLAAVLVFVVSSIIHMALSYHKSDFGQVPSEDGVREALGKFSIPPGEYVIPYAGDTNTMKSPEYQEKLNQGPVAFFTVLPNGPMEMGKSLVQWFVYCIVIGVFSAYITSRAVGPGADYRTVFRFAGATAFIGYGLALWQNTIWYKRRWTTTLKSNFDALVYAACTAGVFGWLWPG